MDLTKLLVLRFCVRVSRLLVSLSHCLSLLLLSSLLLMLKVLALSLLLLLPEFLRQLIQIPRFFLFHSLLFSLSLLRLIKLI